MRLKHSPLRRLSAAGCLVAGLAQAQTLPPAPVSPAPVVNYEYDAQGNPTKTVQAPATAGFGFATTTTYDALNRAKDSTDPKARITRFGYNGREDLIQVTDPRTLVTQYPRNGLGDATSLVSPDTGTATQTYDAAGNLKTRTDSRGVLATYTYDSLNRLTKTTYTKAGETARTYTWTYDQTGAGFSNGIGRLTSSSGSTGTTTYAYDPQGRPVSVAQQMQASTLANPTALTHTVGYGYDAAGQVSRVTYPSGRVLTITPVGGQATQLALAKDGTSTASALISSITYNPDRQPLSWTWQLASGPLTQSWQYDLSGRIVRYRLGSVMRDLTYDAADRITSYTHRKIDTAAAYPSMDQSFAYDELGRLKGVTTATASWALAYDVNGNRTGVTLNGTPNTYTTPTTSNRLSGTSSPARTFSYDAAGNVSADTAAAAPYTTVYWLENRLRTLTRGSVTTTYSYNADGQRIRKFNSTGPNSTVIFVFDQAGHLLGEYDKTGTALREYVWLGDTPVAVFRPDTVTPTNPPLVYFIYTDHLGTPNLVVDKNDQRRWRWLPEPFGTDAPDNNPQALGAFTFNLRFPGQYYDADSGLNYNYFRDYDASIGRYVQSDPIGLAGGSASPYAYVGNNPLSFVDPDGLAYFAKRPLEGLPWLGPLSNNPLDARYNTEISHEQLFFEDSKAPANLGFFSDGSLKSEPNPTGYRARSEKYNDCIMRKAVAVAGMPKGYCIIGRNCQTWADMVKRAYAQLASDASIKKECECP